MPLYHGFHGAWLPEAKAATAGFDALSKLLKGSGPLLPAELHVPEAHAAFLASHGKQPPTPVAGFALVDTGASLTVVAEHAVQSLGLVAADKRPVISPAGVEEQFIFPIELALPGTGLPRGQFARVLASPHLAKAGLVALLGRDALASFVLVYNGPLGIFTLGL